MDSPDLKVPFGNQQSADISLSPSVPTQVASLSEQVKQDQENQQKQEVLVTIPTPVPDPVKPADPIADLLVRFNTVFAPFEADGKTPGSSRKIFQALNGSVVVDKTPEPRLRFGMGSIHTYVIIRQRNGGLFAQLYAMIPAQYNNFIVPFLEGAGVKIDKNPFIRPSGI